MKRKAMPIDIYKSRFGDCSNHGISERFSEILIEHSQGIKEFDDQNPPENLCKVVEREIFGRYYRHVEPVARPTGVGWMAGGCVVDDCDSRARDLLGDYPLRLHDRQETRAEYEMYSH